MKALLYKDAMVLWKQMKLMLLLILVFAVVPSEFQNTFAVLYAALLPYSALAYDERSRWDRMAAAMPYSARDIVTEKYVFGWIAALGTLALTLVLRLVSQYLLHLGEGASAEMLLMAFFGSLIAMAVTLPMMFRFGVEKGRLAMLLLIGLVCGGRRRNGRLHLRLRRRQPPGIAAGRRPSHCRQRRVPPHRRPLLRRPGETVTVNIFAKTITILTVCPGFLRKAGAFSLRREGRSW